MLEVTPIVRFTIREFVSKSNLEESVISLIQKALHAEGSEGSDSYTKEAIETSKQVLLDIYDEYVGNGVSNISYESPIFDDIVFLTSMDMWYSTNY